MSKATATEPRGCDRTLGVFDQQVTSAKNLVKVHRMLYVIQEGDLSLPFDARVPRVAPPARHNSKDKQTEAEDHKRPRLRLTRGRGSACQADQ